MANKATGYPIARVAAKIAIGLRLDEIPNRVTGLTKAAFEPVLDYVVVKIPRWPFDKFPTIDRRLGIQMKATGEVMAIGRSFPEALLKAVRSLDLPARGLRLADAAGWTDAEMVSLVAEATDLRLFALAEALRRGPGGGRHSVLLLGGGGGRRAAGSPRAAHRGAGGGPDPGRAGDRVRLLHRTRGESAAGGGV